MCIRDSCETARLQLADQVEHFRHELSGARLVVRAQDAERIGIFMHEGDETVGQLLDRFAIFDGTPDDLVIDVGNVADVGHVVTAGLEPAIDHVEDDHDAGVPEVAVVINRHAAHVHAYLARFDGREKLLFPFQGVMDFEHRRGISQRGQPFVKLWKGWRSW